MKKKIVLLLAATMVMSLLAGCGNSTKSTSTKTANTQTVDSEKSGNRKIASISQYLNKERVIFYDVSKMDKETIPSNIYFFDNGKLTVINGNEFGLSLGDLSKMKDDEIWKKYKDVRDSYKQNYLKQKEQERQDIINKIQQTMDAADDKTDNCKHEIFGRDLTFNELTTLRDDAKAYVFKGPFYDLPFSIIVQSDASGNNVKTEQIAYHVPNDECRNFKNDKHNDNVYAPNYSSIEFNNTVEGSDVKIYNTTYNCMALSNGKALCTRTALIFDTIDCKDVLVDLKQEQIQALFDDAKARK